MQIRFSRLAVLAVVVASGALVAGCGGGAGSIAPSPSGAVGETGSAAASGISASARVTGIFLEVTARTERTDVAEVWAIVRNSAGYEMFLGLRGSGRDYYGSMDVTADPGSIVTVNVYWRDSYGNQYGPAVIRVRMGEYGAQPAVTGVVVSEEGIPVQGATVTLGNQSTTTDANGKFVLTGLVAGLTLQGNVTKSGFSEAQFTVTVTYGTVQVPTITLQATQELPPAAPVFP